MKKVSSRSLKPFLLNKKIVGSKTASDKIEE